MKVIDKGHYYELANMENPDQPGQEIKFIKKEKSAPQKMGEDVVLETVHDGTTNEEVLYMLINRYKALNAKMWSSENDYIIKRLEEALAMSLYRTYDRDQRKVEGTSKA